MAQQPLIKRYALVAGSGGDGVRRFHLARLEAGPHRTPSPERLERMEDVAAREIRTSSEPEPSNFRPA